MRTTTWFSLSAALVTALAAASASLLASLMQGSPAAAWVHAAVGGAAGIAALAPCLMLASGMSRTSAVLKQRIGAILRGEPISGEPAHGLVAGAFDETLDETRKGLDKLRAQVRDLEIRHHVAESERRQIEIVLNSLRDAVVVTNPFHEISIANEAAAKALGFELPASLHQSLDKVVSDATLCRLVREARDHGAVSEPRHVEHELRIAGDSRVYDITLSSVQAGDNSPAGTVTILHDMTREREISQMKSDFVSKASHELRTPLSSIRAYVEMLVDGEAQDEQSRAEFYRVIQSETDRLGRLIDNMLNISRIEAGIVQIERAQVDMKQLIRRGIETIDPQARGKSTSVNSRCAEVSLTVEGDEDMLYQVVLNLLSNAVKYTPEGGRITVTADTDNLTRSVVVSVSDTGLGIPPDALPRLFDKFYRVENFKRVAKGTGLGLNLCKHIVETVHRGQIGVDSRLGMGSRFWFSIPMRYAGSQAAA
jgi:two-component system, OmpR family, phosphate regulon sensor histidine kinase PhoR